MEDLPFEIRALAHHILQSHGVYRLEMAQLQEMITLLNQEHSNDPKEIQQSLFQGIVKFHQLYGDRVSQGLSDPSFESVSSQTKSLMHKILHEYNFLDKIKAWEIFLPPFQKPIEQYPSNFQSSQRRVLDDEYQKARINYMYYGPTNVYNFPHSLPPLPLPPQRPTFQPQYQPQNFYNYQKQERIQPRLLDWKQGDLQEKNQDEYGQIQKRKEEPFSPLKKKALEKTLNSKQSKQSTGSFLERLEEENKAIGKQASLMNCLCRGSVRTSEVFRCKCKQFFHFSCQNHQTICLACRQAEMDPFYSVSCLVDAFSLNLEKVEGVQCHLDLSKVKDQLFSDQFELLMSCSHPDYSGVCWPDDIRVYLNEYPMLEIPALLLNHQQKQRKDRQMIITPYLKTLQDRNPSLTRATFTVQVMKFRDEQQRRNNRKGTFQMCFFLVKPLTPQDLFKKITKQHECQPTVGPFQILFSEVETESLQVSFKDPYSHQTMQIPARGKNCKHLSCFDLKNYLSMIYYLGDHDWRCPICFQDSRELVIDKYLLSLLNNYKKDGKIPKTVTFFRDGRRECLMAAEQQDMAEQ